MGKYKAKKSIPGIRVGVITLIMTKAWSSFAAMKVMENTP